MSGWVMCGWFWGFVLAVWMGGLKDGLEVGLVDGPVVGWWVVCTAFCTVVWWVV